MGWGIGSGRGLLRGRSRLLVRFLGSVGNAREGGRRARGRDTSVRTEATAAEAEDGTEINDWRALSD
jgi:hypothetical protein